MRYSVKKKAKEADLPLDVTRTIVSLCNDYDRRKAEIEKGRLEEPVLANYHRLNSLIDEAIATVCEEAIREPMRRDIGLGRGHLMSPIYFLSEKTYKLRKRCAKYEIARILSLI